MSVPWLKRIPTQVKSLPIEAHVSLTLRTVPMICSIGRVICCSISIGVALG